MPVCDLWLGNMKIPQASEFKYLGVHINSRLCWKSHIASTIRKANSTLFLLQRGLVGAPTKVKMLSYTSIVRPILEYASQVWSPEFKTLSNQLEKVQRRAIRWAYKIHKFDSVSDAMQKHNITSLFDRRIEADIAFLRRLEFGDYQLKLSNYITGNTAHNTRHGTINPHFRTNVFRNSYYNRIRGEIKFYH